MTVQLPLEALAPLGEHLDLARDQRVELRSVEPREVAVADEAAAFEAEEAHERPVVLDPDACRKALGDAVAKLRVICRKQFRSLGHAQTVDRAAAGTMGLMFDGSSEEAEVVDFERAAQEALDGLPAELRDAMSNVSVVIEDEPPPGQPLLGLYQGVPLTRRGSYYGGVLPDKITIYRGPLLRLYGADPDVLRERIRHVVLHEVAHHFGISDQRLLDMGAY